jgi:hypothetical protein
MYRASGEAVWGAAAGRMQTSHYVQVSVRWWSQLLIIRGTNIVLSGYTVLRQPPKRESKRDQHLVVTIIRGTNAFQKRLQIDITQLRRAVQSTLGISISE